MVLADMDRLCAQLDIGDFPTTYCAVFAHSGRSYAEPWTSALAGVAIDVRRGKRMRFEAVVFALFGTLVPGFSEERFNASLAAMAGARVLENRYGRLRWRSSSMISRRPEV